MNEQGHLHVNLVSSAPQGHALDHRVPLPLFLAPSPRVNTEPSPITWKTQTVPALNQKEIGQLPQEASFPAELL